MSTEFYKINAPYKRDQKTHAMMEGDWSLPEFDYLQNNEWLWTEKIDGTNIRVIWDGREVTFGGRTDNAQTPKALANALHDIFVRPSDDPYQRFREAFPDATPDALVVLYGEGYGPKINGGGKYRDTPGFILFEVKVARWWLLRADVYDVAKKLAIDAVPECGVGSIHEAIQVVSNGLGSFLGNFDAEGMVGVTRVPLFSRDGKRITIKVKGVDFK